jgi:hypothetical protein
MPDQVCLFCGGCATEPDHAARCDGRQGRLESAARLVPARVPAFDGATYDPTLDHERLGAQAIRVWAVISDGRWRTLGEIETACGDPQASISARLRDFRKPRFGSHVIARRRRGDGAAGVFEYRLAGSPGETLTEGRSNATHA